MRTHHRLASLLLALLCSFPALARDYLIEDGDTAGLVAAVEAANRSSEPDRIFLPAGGRFVFMTPAPGAGTALPAIGGTLDLIGNGSELRRYSDQAFALIDISSVATVRLIDVLLADGGTGAIVNRGDLLAWGVTIEDSSARSGAAALLNSGKARLLACDIRFNSYAGAAGTGGAIVNRGELAIADSRIYGNTAFGGGLNAEFGAALTNYGVAELASVVVAENGAAAGSVRSGAIANFAPGHLVIRDSVIEDNVPAALATVRAAGVVDLSATRIHR